MAATEKETDSMELMPKKLVCYYLPRAHLLNVTDIDPNLCTHLVFAFAKIEDNKLTENTPADVKLYGNMNDLKYVNSQLKVVLSVQQGFPALVNSDENVHKSFYKQSISFLREYGFDGIDLDWEFPPASAKVKYSNFLVGFRKAIMNESQSWQRTPLLLTAALPNSKSKINNYNMTVLANTLDFATAMTYDFHMFIKNVDTVTSFNSALYPIKGENQLYSVSGLIDYYLEQGFPASKLLFGVPTYGRTFLLEDPDKHGVHASAVCRGDGGPILHKKGVYSYGESCLALKNGATRIWDENCAVPYLYKDKLWCTYEDEESARRKALYFVNKLAGAGVWTLTLDDPRGINGKKFPIINAIKNVFKASVQP